MIKTAQLSRAGKYRYELTRQWADGPACTFIMLNPSTADADVDDPTIRRCINFAKREKCGMLVVVNLFAFRATSPKVMKEARNPIGPENNWYIKMALEDADGPIIAAWGAHGSFKGRSAEISRKYGHFFKCFNHTKLGEPLHPLYLPNHQPLINFN